MSVQITMGRIPATVLLFVAYIYCSTCLVQSTPAGAFPLHDLDDVKSIEYKLSFENLEKDGKCRQRIHVRGKGIRDSFLVSCDNKGVTGVKSVDLLIYHNTGDALSLLSERPAQLVVVEGDRCTLKTYSTVRRKTTALSNPMTPTDCEKAKKRITNAETRMTSYSSYGVRYLFGTIWRSYPVCFPFCIGSAILDILKSWPALYDTKPGVNKDNKKKAESFEDGSKEESKGSVKDGSKQKKKADPVEDFNGDDSRKADPEDDLKNNKPRKLKSEDTEHPSDPEKGVKYGDGNNAESQEAAPDDWSF